MQQRKIPLRHCLGCNESKPKKELVRVVRSPEGEIFWILWAKSPAGALTFAPAPNAWPRPARPSAWSARWILKFRPRYTKASSAK